jgi:hypothetical protein
MRFYYGIDCVIIAKRKRCLLYSCMVGSGDTADVEGAVLHSPEPVKEYGLAIEMSCTSTLSWSRQLTVSKRQVAGSGFPDHS